MGPAPGRAIGAATQHAHTHLGGQVLEGAKIGFTKCQKSKKAPHTTIICLWAAAIVAAIGDCSPCFSLWCSGCVSNCSFAEPNKTTDTTFPLQNQQATRGFWQGVHGVLFRRKFFDDEIFNFKRFSPHCQATETRRRGLHQGHCSAVTDGF